jgi:hypothetical protein
MNSGGTGAAQGLSNVISHAARSTQDAGGFIYPGTNVIENHTGRIERTYPPGSGPAPGEAHVHVNIDGKNIVDAITPVLYQKASRNNGNANAGAYWPPGNKR